MKSELFVGTCIAVVIAICPGLAVADPTAPDVDPWVQGQIDALTENVPGFLDSINRSGIDRSGINDQDLVIKGHQICYAIYAHRGDLSGARLPNTAADDWHAMEVVAGASIKYLCPPAAAYASPALPQAAP